MVSANFSPDLADAAKDAVRLTVTELAKDGARSDGLPYKAAHHLYQVSNGKICNDQAWHAVKDAIKHMINDGELFAPQDHTGDWELNHI